MEKLGEIMKTCNNCKFEGNKGYCGTCIICGDTFSNWQPLPMEEIKVEDYEVITQADGLVKLMAKVDEVITQADGLVKLMAKVDEKPIIKVRVKTWDEVCFENMAKFSPEVLKRAKEFWDESKIELVLPENRIIEVYPHNKEQYYYEGHYIAKNFATEILEEESCEKVSLDSPEHPSNQELLPELDTFKLTNNNLAIFKQIQNKSHLCHYTKFQLDFDINTSIRFIHAFDDRPELVGKFIYKHHEEKLFSVIEPQLAEHFIKTQCSNEAEEFINRYVGQGKKRQYRRIKVTENSLTKYFES